MTDTDVAGVGHVPDAGSEDPVPDLEQEMLVLFRRMRGLVGVRARALHPKLDAACYPMIMTLRHRDAVPMADLLVELGIEKSTLTRRIDAAARLGLVERIPDPHDARARLVALTAEGRERVAALQAAETQRWRERLDSWEPTDVRNLTALLMRLSASIEDDAT
ncbi:MarR family winged helix-turn-helix transcriptional regulator [Rhodococcus sp. (in: high G+C Gram-positive bacteria)]|uniref:MarR family winged helix-turn-helix transcriptional regulator n=2 Tax=Rhodococcus TaxID=1827 RepID=UPI00338F7635